MDQKLIKSHDKEFMKMAMLKHEKIFREQVYELHRLYRIQKLLMNTVEGGAARKKQEVRWISGNHQFNGSDQPDQHHGGAQIAAASNYSKGLGLIEENEIQLTLGPSIYSTSSPNHSQKRSNSGQSMSSCNSTVSNQIRNADTTAREDFTWNFGHASKNGRQMNLGEGNLRQDRMVFQALSLKLT